MKKFIYSKNAVICEIINLRGKFTGVAKCNPHDTFDVKVGEKIASLRADLKLRKYDLGEIRFAQELAKSTYEQTGTKLWMQWAQDAARVEKKQLLHIKNIKNQLNELYNG